MKFANKELEKRITAQIIVINGIDSDISKLRNSMQAVVGLKEQKVIWDALFAKFYSLGKQLPGEERNLEKLYWQNEVAFNNRSNRRQDLINSMFTPERLIPA